MGSPTASMRDPAGRITAFICLGTEIGPADMTSDTPKIRRYLNDRAAAVPRSVGQRRLLASSLSLVGVE